MAANAFAWVEIYVQDLERAKSFYEAVFGFQLEKLESQIPMWAFPSDSSQWGAGGALVHMPGVLPISRATATSRRCSPMWRSMAASAAVLLRDPQRAEPAEALLFAMAGLALPSAMGSLMASAICGRAG